MAVNVKVSLFTCTWLQPLTFHSPRPSVVDCIRVLFLRSITLCIIMMITIAAITATATAMMTTTLAIITGFGDNILPC